MTGEAIAHAIKAGAHAEAAELIQASWVSYASSFSYDTALAWLAGGSSLAYRSLIAGELGRLEDQRTLAEGAADLVREHGTEASGVIPLALGVSLAARGQPEQAGPLIERCAGFLRSRASRPRRRWRCCTRGRCCVRWASGSALAGGGHRGTIHHRILSRSGHPGRAAEGSRTVPAAGHQISG